MRIDRRTNLERGLAAARETHRGWAEPALESPGVEPSENQEVDAGGELVSSAPLEGEESAEPLEVYGGDEETEAAPECPPMPVDALDDDDYPEPSETPPDEEEMAEKLPPREAVMVASQFYDELRDLRILRAKLEGYSQALVNASKHLEVAAAESTSAFNAKVTAERQYETAKERLQQFQTDHGLAGRSFSIGFGKWKLEWKSALRKQGEQAQANFERLSTSLESAEAALTNANNQVTRWETSKSQREQDRDSVQQEIDAALAKYGEHATLETAEKTLNHTAHLYLEGVTAEDLLDLYESGQISTSQYQDALELFGETELLEQLGMKKLEDLDERIDRGLEA